MKPIQSLIYNPPPHGINGPAVSSGSEPTESDHCRTDGESARQPATPAWTTRVGQGPAAWSGLSVRWWLRMGVMYMKSDWKHSVRSQRTMEPVALTVIWSKIYVKLAMLPLWKESRTILYNQLRNIEWIGNMRSGIEQFAVKEKNR